MVLQTFDSFSAVYKGWIWALLIAVLFAQLFSYMSRSRLYNVITLLNYIGKYTLELYIGLDVSKNILIQFMGFKHILLAPINLWQYSIRVLI